MSSLREDPHLPPDGVELCLDELLQFIDQHSDEEIKNAIGSENFSSLIHFPPNLRERLKASQEIWTDIWWYVEVRHELQIEDFPCVHIAYGMSSRSNYVINCTHSVYTIRTDRENAEGIVIGYCPWCAKPLNTAAK